jgi:phage virion morphogenesis protein
MSGTSIKIDVDDAEFNAAIRQLLERLESPRAAFADIGEYLVRSVEERFETEIAPDGTPWAPLHAGTKAAKKHPKILTESRELRRSIVHQETDTALLIGTNKIYAAIHQLGGTTKAHEIRPRHKKALAWPGMMGGGDDAHPVGAVQHPGSKIPARPFLGLSPADREEALAILADYLNPDAGQ